ncbi:MAG: hypothetical protein JNK74_09870 [Candidatus Hydrogenedentes bacterium]|nr:hypothetical protein [Candidatus Hydrogenedentota bacterium]
MSNSKLVYINLALVATFAMVVSSGEQPGQEDDGRVRTVFITTDAPDSEDRASIARACEAVENDWNGPVTLLGCENDAPSIARALKRAIALAPDGISLPGHRDDALILPFVIEARRQGILVTFHDTPLPAARKRFGPTGAGFIGDRGEHSGFSLAEAAVDRLSISPESKVLVISGTADVAPGSRLRGCLDLLSARAIEPERLVAAPLGDELEDFLPDPALAKRINEGPLPDVIFWDAGPVSQIATMLDGRGADYNTISVVSLVPVTTALTESEAPFVKLRAYEQPFLTCYFSLTQLHLTHKYGAPGLEVPIGGA